MQMLSTRAREKETDRQTDRQTRHTDRQTNTQTGTERQTATDRNDIFERVPYKGTQQEWEKIAKNGRWLRRVDSYG